MLYNIGLGVNYDKSTGIHYGVISEHSVMGEIWESFDPVYEIECPSCGTVSEESDCPKCGTDNSREFEFCDSPSYERYTGDKDYALDYSETLNAFYVIRAPYYTYAALCSPCAPNAGDIDSPRSAENGGVKSYCLDASYFENDNAPYPIYRVSDNTLVSENARA